MSKAKIERRLVFSYYHIGFSFQCYERDLFGKKMKKKQKKKKKENLLTTRQLSLFLLFFGVRIHFLFRETSDWLWWLENEPYIRTHTL